MARQCRNARQSKKLLILGISFTVRLKKLIGYCQTISQYRMHKNRGRAIHSHLFRAKSFRVMRFVRNDFQIRKTFPLIKTMK